MKKINYSQCWEDANLLKSALKIKNSDIVLSITSGGDNSLALLLYNPKEFFLVDKNPVQNYLAELKLKAPQVLSHSQYLELLGVNESESRLKYFEKVSNLLSSEATSWFAQNEKVIRDGIIHRGKFEKYLNKFRRFILPLVHSEQTVFQFMNQNDLQSQIAFYKKTWNTWRWRLFFQIASNASLLNKFARQIGTVSHKNITKDTDYLKRLENLIYRSLLKNNYYLCYSLFREYGKSCPDYLSASGYTRLRKCENKSYKFHSEDLLSFLNKTPDNILTKFNLSDFFEFLTPEEILNVWKQIIRTAKNGAVVVYWCNQLEQVPPYPLSQHIVRDSNLEMQLSKQDRLYFYRSFHIYTVKK